MNTINKRYAELMKECGINNENVRNNCRKLIIHYIPEVDTKKSVRRNESEKICVNETTKTTTKLLTIIKLKT